MQRLYQEIANQYHVSADEVETEIVKAIQLGMQQSDPAIQREWRAVSTTQEPLSPENVIGYIIAKILLETRADDCTAAQSEPFVFAVTS